jgi:REP element-mobilizing transposase RayT
MRNGRTIRFQRSIWGSDGSEAGSQQYGALIETMEVLPDHIHLFVTSDPTRCVAELLLSQHSRNVTMTSAFSIAVTCAAWSQSRRPRSAQLPLC